MHVSAMLAVIGLFAVTCFGMVAKRKILAGPMSSWIAWFQIPAGVSLLWRLAQSIHWWTILAFVLTSLVGGIVMAAPLLRVNRGDPDALEMVMAMKTVAGLIFIGCAIG